MIEDIKNVIISSRNKIDLCLIWLSTFTISLHYCELLSIENEEERYFYEKEWINLNWSVKELNR